MNYAVADGHPAITQLIALCGEIPEQNLPRSFESVEETAQTLLCSVPGAPPASDFDVLALDSEGQDVHLLLRRRSDGLLARASYIEGEDLSDDIDIFEYLDEDNREGILARFDRWCGFNLEDEDAAAYRALVADMVPVEWTPARQVEDDLLVIAPTLKTLEELGGRVATERLRSVISAAVAAIRSAADPV